MKINVMFAILGPAAGVTPSLSQGFVSFSSYSANNEQGAIATIFLGGSPIPLGIGYTADLYNALGTVSDPVNIFSAGTAPTGLTDLGVFAAYDNSGIATGVAGLGYFNGPVVTIPDYTRGPITFEVVAFYGSSYGTSTDRGRSGSFTMDSIATGSPPAPALGDNSQPMPNFIEAVMIPEPATLALAGLGGLVALATFRRKQS
jgi:hypothetical protein